MKIKLIRQYLWKCIWTDGHDMHTNYNIDNYWLSRLCPSSHILQKTHLRRMIPSSGEMTSRHLFSWVY
jgi:hypothetical protein